MKIMLQLFGGRGTSSFRIRTVHGYTTKIHSGRQQKHIEGSNNYSGNRSKLTISESKAQELINKFAGNKGNKWQSLNKEKINFNEVIGKYYNQSNGRWEDTTWGIIHYSKDGSHLVPANPNQY